MGTESLLNEVAAEVRDCVRCPLSRGRTRAVPGEGNPLTDVLLVGEGPGGREDATGRPFVGPAGQLLTELLRALRAEGVEMDARHADAVAGALGNNIRSSIAQIDKASAKELKAGLEEASEGLAG